MTRPDGAAPVAVPAPGPLAEPPALFEAYRRMVLVRRFEERAADLYRDSLVPGFLHLSLGQEASAVGACWPLRADDVITSTHRGHGHCLAKGMSPGPMIAELMGKVTGTCRGRGGSMHIADPSLGVFGANGIVGAGLPIAVGAAFAARFQGRDAVAVAFFGDGAASQGYFHEAVNLASLWHLPVLFVCENNHYSEFSPEELVQPVAPVERAAGYGIEGHRVDGTDVVEVAALVGELADRARRGEGPFLVEADTERWSGHYVGDPERYRDPAERDRHQARDPLARARARLGRLGFDTRSFDAVEAEVGADLDAAIDAATAAAEPDPASLADFVYRHRGSAQSHGAPAVPAGGPGPRLAPATSPSAGKYRLMDAVNEALARSLEDDERVFLAGIDVAAGGNVFGITRGLAERYPGRAHDTPISESAILGLAVGAAMAGLRPVVEIMYLDFLGVCFDQLLNQAAKLGFMTGGRAEMALVVRTQFGAGRSSGSQHSQSLEAMLAHIPGLTVALPCTPEDTYGMLRAAIADPNPVVFIENRRTYGLEGTRPPADHFVPLGQARVARPGRDVTVVSVSRMVHECLAAADGLAAEGIDAEVIDLRTVSPLDRGTVLASLERTGRLVIAHEAVTDFGIGAELAALAAGEGFGYLDAPVARVGAPFTPAPYAPSLEKAWLPDRHTIARAAREVARF